MRLFDRYLMACTNQRIPMPAVWQESLGLRLDKTKQESIEGTNSMENTGYLFQQDDPLERGFVNHTSRTKTRTSKNDYIMQLYLQAIKYHKGEDYTSYFLPSETVYEFPNYITRVPVILGETYSIYGATTLPIRVLIYSELTGSTEPLYDSNSTVLEPASLSFLRQKVIDTTFLCSAALQGLEEYLIMEVIGNVGVAIVSGSYDLLPLQKEDDLNVSSFGARFIEGRNADLLYPACLPSVAYFQKPYSEKLIPSLLGINITDNSSPVARTMLPDTLSGQSTEEKIRVNTEGLYDIDENLGRNFKW